jgi:hypothetical protein
VLPPGSNGSGGYALVSDLPYLLECAGNERYISIGIVLLLDSAVAFGPSADGSKRRMKRHEKQVTLFFTGLAFLDLVITSFYLGAIPKDDGRGLEVANEVVALLPDLLSPMRLTGPKSTAALVVVDGVATLVTLGIGSKLLANDVAELEAAIQAD